MSTFFSIYSYKSLITDAKSPFTDAEMFVWHVFVDKVNGNEKLYTLVFRYMDLDPK